MLLFTGVKLVTENLLCPMEGQLNQAVVKGGAITRSAQVLKLGFSQNQKPKKWGKRASRKLDEPWFQM